MGPILAKIHFERAGNSADAWASVAENLCFAAQVLLEKSDEAETLAPDQEVTQLSNRARLGAIELMLKGMAMECLLKALWVKQGNLFVQAGDFEPVFGAGAHDLRQLAQAVSISTTPHESDLLGRLSHFIEYGGRYPIPKKSMKLGFISSPSGGKASPMTWTTPTDNVLFEGLVSKITELLTQ